MMDLRLDPPVEQYPYTLIKKFLAIGTTISGNSLYQHLTVQVKIDVRQQIKELFGREVVLLRITHLMSEGGGEGGRGGVTRHTHSNQQVLEEKNIQS